MDEELDTLQDGFFDEPILLEAQIEGVLEAKAWRLAKSLVVLRDEINQIAPNRNKGYDGTIGDAAHAARPSRHNPNKNGVVCALDITHDPAHGMDIHTTIRNYLKSGKIHPDLTYVISNRQIARRSNNWVWKKYSGSNAHDKHVHFAVGLGSDSNPTPPYDNTVAWGIAKPRRTLKLTEPKMSGNDVLEAQKLLAYYGYQIELDGVFGPKTDAIFRSFQASKMLKSDGVCGPITYAELIAKNPDRTLKQGMNGKDVLWLQKVLVKISIANLELDGKFGSNTLVAVKAFQKANKLTEDGIVGPKTWQMLRYRSNS